MRASHWVIEDIIKALETGNLSETCEKFAQRYHKDNELKAILSVKKPDTGKIKKALEDLANKRKFMESSGGTDLWMADRRKGSTETKLR